MRQWNIGSYISARQLLREQRVELSFLEPRARAGVSLGILTSLSLVSQSSDKIVSVHPLVHEWIQARLKPNPTEFTRFLRLCSLILYQAFPLEGIASSYMPHFTDVIPFTPHLLQLLDALEQAKQYSEPMPLELRTLLLAHLLFEARQENAYSPTSPPPLIVRVFPSDLSDAKSPIEGIQSQLFDELREVSSLWDATTLDRIMKVLRLGLSNYSLAPPWTFSRMVYMVALVTFVLEIVKHWLLYTGTASKLRSGFRNQQPHKPYYKTRKHTAGTLYTILSFLSSGTGRVPEEISFLQVRVRLVLAQIITIGEYKKLPWHFFRDGISWERVACVDLLTAFEYFVACAKFSRPYPKEMAEALTFAVKAFYKLQQPNNITSDASVPFLSRSFGANFESYIPRLSTNSIVIPFKVLNDACLECCSVLLKDLEYRSPTSLTDERNVGSYLLSILEARDEARSGIEDMTVDNGEGKIFQLSVLDTQHFEFQCLYVHAHFLRAAYGEAILSLQKLFQAEKVMSRISSEYDNSCHLLLDHKDSGNGEATAIKTTFLSYIFRPFWRETLRYQVPIVDPSGVRHQESFNSSSEDLNIGEQAVAWYAQESQLEDLDVAKDLLRIWVDCVGHLKPIEARDLETWRNRVDAIPRIYSPETITMVHTLAKASVEPWDQFGARSVHDAERRVRSESTSLGKSTKGDSPPAEVDGE
ncbi:hypothetical protein GGS24DRAFT_479192 [Hypoxylon argillaceum]|nr:hypothetical protein GGS24DRAFT_479192 [Hypoxylon argillaceum]